MNTGSLKQSQQNLRVLRADMQEADDKKIRQIVALLDGSPGNQTLQTVLDPLRPRLAALAPLRPLRFTRLLFLPLDDLIVPAPDWRPGRATIPRSVLNSLSVTVQAALGHETEVIERMIAGHNTHETEVITQAGEELWHRAAEILTQAPPPIEWRHTGLQATAYAPLARAIAVVLRRVSPLRRLLRDAELGVLGLDEQAFKKIISNMVGEPAEGCAMVFKLMLSQLPQAAALLRRLVEASPTAAERALLQKAMNCGTEDVLADLESSSRLTDGLRNGALAAVGTEAQRIATILQDVNDNTNSVQNRARLKGIREKLDVVCRGRFADGMKQGLVTPLGLANAPVDSAGQKQLESCARDLRMVETAGRKLGSPTTYDGLLSEASEAVQAAMETGNLGATRAVRLVEILSGPEAAEAIYKRVIAPASRIR